MYPFNEGFSMILSGPSGGGKTTFVYNMMKEPDMFLTDKKLKLMIAYGIYQKAYDKFKDAVETQFCSGLPTESDIDQFSSENRNCVIFIDDLGFESANSKLVCDLFVKICHHRNITVLLSLQNTYTPGHYMRTIMLSCKYLVIFESPRDQTSLQVLSRQMFNNSHILPECYADAIKEKWRPLVIDMTSSTPSEHRIRTGVLKNQVTYCYVIK